VETGAAHGSVRRYIPYTGCLSSIASDEETPKKFINNKIAIIPLKLS
jgi:hypothetical protein